MLNLRKSICNLFCKGIQLPFIRFNFTIYPSWKDRNLMKFDKLPQVDDELKFPHESEEVTGGIKQLCENLKQNSQTFISGKGACMLMYNCGVKNIHEPEVFKMCERDIERYTDDLEPRLVYGALYGALKTNAASPFLMNFFLNEFHKINKLINEKQEIQHEEEIEAENFEEQKEEEKNILVKKKKKKKSPIIFGLLEYHQLFEACSLNTSLKKKQLFEFIVEEIKPFIIAQGFGINYSNCVKLIEQMIRLDFYDKELWSLALNKLEYKIRFNNLIFIQSFYDKLLKSKDCGKNPHDLTKILTKLKNKLGSKVDYRWRYNLEENRFYTFQELKSNRDNYNFPEQSMNLKSPFQKRRLKLFKKKTDATSELKAKKKKMTLEKELEELTFERFIKNKTLEDQQLEDSESPSTEKELEEEKEIEDFLINRDKNRRKQKKNYEKQDLDITQSKEEEKQLTPEELEENERKEIKAEKEAARKKMMLERKKKDNAKLGKGKNKALGKMMKDQDFEQSGDR